jgi:hypothetical protein
MGIAMPNIEHDPGPPAAFADKFAAMPSYAALKDHFWFDWGPVFYRGRLDGSARILCFASDPGPTERIAGRTLVGDAGQRTQGFLASHEESVLLTRWAQAVTELRSIVTPDPDGDATLPNYGADFLESDYRPIPRRDLPFGAPPFLGDDSAGRAATPPRLSSVSRPFPDDRHTLTWIAPKSDV